MKLILTAQYAALDQHLDPIMGKESAGSLVSHINTTVGAPPPPFQPTIALSFSSSLLLVALASVNSLSSMVRLPTVSESRPDCISSLASYTGEDAYY